MTARKRCVDCGGFHLRGTRPNGPPNDRRILIYREDNPDGYVIVSEHKAKYA